MIRISALAIVSGISLAASAQAADLPNRKAPALAPPAFTWTGFYVGANAGYAFGSYKTTGYNIVAILPGRQPHTSGGLFGAQAGYNYQIGQVVIGAEADFDFANVKGSYAQAVLGNPNALNVSGKLNNIGTLKARLGYAFNNVLVFATGGYAFGSMKSAYTLSIPAPPIVSSGSATKTVSGYTFGAGVEYALTNNWIIKADYQFISFGNKNFNGGNVPVINSAAASNFKSVTNEIRLGVNYKF